jgi:anti-anti-sigma regulatory factor
MASNFEIGIDKNSDGLGLKLAGDFDATSAYELIYAIKKLPEETAKICIYTNDLKNIHPFGLDVFHRFMSSLNGQSTKFVFTGNSAFQLSPGNSRLTS